MTAFQPIDRLMHTLRIGLPGATDAGINLALFNVIDYFLRKTNAWRWEQEIPLAIGTTQYPLAPPAGTQLVRVMGVNYADAPVRQTMEYGAVNPYLFGYEVVYPDYFILGTEPTAETVNSPIKLLLALTLAATELENDPGEWSLPDWMYERYFHDWEAGVLSSMMASKAKPYTDPQMALVHGKRFRQSISFAKQEMDRGMVHAQQRWRFPRFA